ncbi:MAG: sel1 repeat family protein [Pseudomonadales bacterium]|nr:sel1 repeat family protein [Pseudomonadales bacterium]NRA17381.1 sel1 repeat family protein [Oceanospirillaceae bacterium]
MNNKTLLSVISLIGCLIVNPVNAASLSKANAAIEAKDYKTALHELKPLVDAGKPSATNLMGKMYQNGWGVPASIERAKAFYKKGARSGHIDSVNSLRALDDIAYLKELQLIKEKASAGNATAQNRFGEMLEYGFGVKRDLNAAFAQYQLAADQGYVVAQHNVGRSYNFGTGVAQDYAKAENWYRIAANKGYNQSMFYLGTLYATAHGQDNSTSQDIIAFAWMNNAAALGDSTAASIESRLLMKLKKEQIQEAKDLAEKYKKTYVIPFQ